MYKAEAEKQIMSLQYVHLIIWQLDHSIDSTKKGMVIFI